MDHTEDSLSMLGDELLDNLDKLRARLAEAHDRIKVSGVSRTIGLRDHKGKSCGYYLKSLAHFLRTDYNDLKTLVSDLDELFKKCEEIND